MHVDVYSGSQLTESPSSTSDIQTGETQSVLDDNLKESRECGNSVWTPSDEGAGRGGGGGGHITGMMTIDV